MDARQQARDRPDAEAPPPTDDDADGGEPLLPRREQPQQQGPAAAAAAGAAARRRRWWCWCRPGGGASWLTILGFVFLTLNSGMAIHRSRGERGAVAFVVASYVDLLLLFACLRWYENARPESSSRAWLKVAVWVLTTALTILFSAKVAAVMPPAVAVVVWLMAFATVAGGFYAFFCYAEKA